MAAEKKEIQITAPDLRTLQFQIVGTAPYVQNRFSAKAKEKMKAKLESGQTRKRGRADDANDFRALYERAMHKASDGKSEWYGIPAPAFRNACIDACRMVNFKMTYAKMSLFVEADGFDINDGTPLVRITKGEPEYTEMMVRQQMSAVVRPRPMWRDGWEADLRVTYDADQFTAEEVTNLLVRAGEQVGVGEGRPFSKASAGMGWGKFKIKGE